MKTKDQNKAVSMPGISTDPQSGKYWRNLLSCFSTNATSRDQESDFESNESLDKNLKVAEENFSELNLNSSISTEVDGIVTLNERPKIVYWNVNSSKKNPVLEHSSLFDGTFEKHSVSVKRIAKRMSHAAVNEEKILLRSVDNEHFIRYFCTLQDPEYWYLITDNYEISLDDYVKEKVNGPKMPMKTIFQQLASAVEFMHQKNILLLNLNPHNIRFASANGSPKVKLTNFETSIQMSGNCKVSMPYYTGMKGFIAPEIKRLQQASFASDIYSLGCIFVYIYTGGDYVPQVDCPQQDWKLSSKLQKEIAKQKDSDGVLCAILMRRMLSFFSKKRLTIAVVREHSFFWNTHEKSDFILEVAIKLEDEVNFGINQVKLELNKVQVMGANWRDRVDAEICAELDKFRPYDGSSLFQLLRAIRNQMVHKRLPKCVEIIGETKEALMDYWLARFPQLIPHLQRVVKTFA